MAKSSIHFEPVKTSSEIHNYRLKDFDYIRKDLKHLNESWTGDTIPNTRKNIEEKYFATVRQKMQAKATPIREGVLNIEKHHTMDDLKRVSNAIEQRWGIRTFQIHIHRDEGHRGSQKAWKSNLHAHILSNWTDPKTGKSIRLGPDDMKEMQSIVADTLSMERGKSSDKKHLNAIQFKNEAEEKRLEDIEKAKIEAEKALSEAIHSKEEERTKTEELARLKDQQMRIITELTAKSATTKKEVEMREADLKHLEGIKRGLNDLEGKYIARTILGTVDSAKTAENINALHLSHQETKKELEDLKKSYATLNKNSKNLNDEHVRLKKRFSDTREHLYLLAGITLSKGKLLLPTSGEEALREFLAKEFTKPIDRFIEQSVNQKLNQGLGKKDIDR
jgi:hypothetical protein